MEAASKKAVSSGRPLAAVVKEEPAIAGNLGADEIERALDPARYLGAADAMIDAAIAEFTRKES